MKLSIHQLDDLCDIQHNLPTAELDEAIDMLSREQLVVLRHDCLASVQRQNGILARIDERLSRN